MGACGGSTITALFHEIVLSIPDFFGSPSARGGGGKTGYRHYVKTSVEGTMKTKHSLTGESMF